MYPGLETLKWTVTLSNGLWSVAFAIRAETARSPPGGTTVWPSDMLTVTYDETRSWYRASARGLPHPVAVFQPGPAGPRQFDPEVMPTSPWASEPISSPAPML